MPLTLDETNTLIAALGLNIPPAVLQQKAMAETFQKRVAQIGGEAAGKNGGWQFKAQFDDAMKRANGDAGGRQFEAALKCLDECEEILKRPPAPRPPPPPPVQQAKAAAPAAPPPPPPPPAPATPGTAASTEAASSSAPPTAPTPPTPPTPPQVPASTSAPTPPTPPTAPQGAAATKPPPPPGTAGPGKLPGPAAKTGAKTGKADKHGHDHKHDHGHNHAERATKALAKLRTKRYASLNEAGDSLGEALKKDKSKATKDLLAALKDPKLDPKVRDESTTEKLKDLQAACAEWLCQPDLKSDAMPVVRNLLNEIRMEVMDVEMDLKKGRREALAAANTDAELTTALGPKGATALQGYDAAVKGGKKNGAEALSALDAFEESCSAWLDDPKNKKHPERNKVKAALAGAQKEMGSIRETQAALKQMKKPAANFKKTGVWSGPGVKGVEISSAKTIKDVGFVPGSDERQITEFLDTLEREAERSDVFAALAKDMTSGTSPTPLKMAFGKNSCGFGDSSATMAVDLDDMRSLPDKPSSVQMRDGTQALGGTTGTEVLLHVLEERFYMQQNGGDYSDAHDRCLSPGSLQNRYRGELGIQSSSVIFDCHEHDHGPAVKPSEQLADFISIDSRGVIQTTKDIKFHKDADPGGTAYTPDPSQTGSLVAGDLVAEMDARLQKAWDEVFLKPLTATHGQRGFDENKTNLRTMEQYLDRKFDGDAAQVNKAMGDYKKAYQVEAVRLKKKFKEDQKQWRTDLGKKTKATEAFLAEDPDKDDPGSQELQARREQRARIHINDSCNNKNMEGSMAGMAYQDQNCALTSLGAILGKNSSEVVETYLRKHGASPATAKKYSCVQDTTIFWRAEQDKLSTNKFMFGEGDMPTSESAPEIGDAQLGGIRELISSEVEARNKKPGGLRYKAIQDGSPDKGQMYPMADLLSRMKKYPGGTQFQVFLNAGVSAPGVHGSRHWIYAEIYKGKLVIEDYQKTVDEQKKPTKQTAYVVGDDNTGPNHPTLDEPGVFTEGCFIALVPDVAALKNVDPPDTKNAKFPQLK